MNPVLSTLAATFRLTTYQLLGGRRRLLTLVTFLLPVGLAFLARVLLPARAFQDPTVGYAMMLLGIYVGVFVPFMAVYWGSAVLTDEIEGKTLVFLWTRPSGRSPVITLKFGIAMGWLILLVIPSLAATYAVLSWRSGLRLHEFQAVIWDGRALALEALTYGALAFFLSSLVKRPLMTALLYVFSLDLFGTFLPGYLRLISVRHYVVTLTTQKQEDDSLPASRLGRRLMELVEQVETTESEAIWTMLIASTVMIALGAFFLRRREFMGDDPVRNQ